MRKFLLSFLMIVFAAVLTACGKTGDTEQAEFSLTENAVTSIADSPTENTEYKSTDEDIEN